MNIDKGLDHLKNADIKMARLIAEFETPEFRKESNYFEALVRAIVYQQLSGKAASTIYKRFKDLFSGDNYSLPKKVLAKPHESLRSSGLSNQKAAYIHNIANAFDSGAVNQNIDSLKDEKIIEKLTTIKGVGTWTAEMFLMFTLNRLDVFPVLDLGIKKGFAKFFGLKNMPSENFMIKKANKWKPYRSIAAHYFWSISDN